MKCEPPPRPSLGKTVSERLFKQGLQNVTREIDDEMVSESEIVITMESLAGRFSKLSTEFMTPGEKRRRSG